MRVWQIDEASDVNLWSKKKERKANGRKRNGRELKRKEEKWREKEKNQILKKVDEERDVLGADTFKSRGLSRWDKRQKKEDENWINSKVEIHFQVWIYCACSIFNCRPSRAKPNKKCVTKDEKHEKKVEAKTWRMLNNKRRKFLKHQFALGADDKLTAVSVCRKIACIQIASNTWNKTKKVWRWIDKRQIWLRGCHIMIWYKALSINQFLHFFLSLFSSDFKVLFSFSSQMMMRENAFLQLFLICICLIQTW